MSRIKIFTIVAIIVTAFSCVQCRGSNGGTTPEDWTTFDKDGYSIQYPENLTMQYPGIMGASFMLFFPLESETDDFRENINLMIEDVTGIDISFDQYVELTLSNMKALLSEYNIIENERFEKDGLSFHRVIGTFSQGLLKVKSEMCCTIAGDKAYVLTFSTEQETYDDYKDVGKQIMDSFKITK